MHQDRKEREKVTSGGFGLSISFVANNLGKRILRTHLHGGAKKEGKYSLSTPSPWLGSAALEAFVARGEVVRIATGAVPIAGAHIARKVSHATNSANKSKKSRNIRNGDV